MKKQIQKYLESLVKFPAYTLSEQERVAIQKAGVVPFIEKQMFSNKFRKSKPSKSVIEETKKRIASSVATNSPIAAAYRPGVKLDYFSNSWLVKIISRYPQSDLDAYTESFRELIGLYAPYLPSNVEIAYNVVAEQKPEEELKRRILKNREAVEAEWNQLSKQKRKEKLGYSERNIRWDLLEKDEDLEESEREKLIYEGKIVHDCLLKGGWNSDPYFLHLATVAGSFVQFWVGIGILEKRGERLIPRILSYEQYKDVESKLEVVKLDNWSGTMREIEILNTKVESK